jgi:hypothetical protein
MIVALASAAGSLGFLFHASRSRPPLLMLIFVVWVVTPFAGLMAADSRSSGWPMAARVTLYRLMLLVGLGSLALYGQDALWPRRTQAAFLYLIVPPVSCILIAAALAIASFVGGRRP